MVFFVFLLEFGAVSYSVVFVVFLVEFELFQQCGICCFSIRVWSCSYSVVIFVFLLEVGVVTTVWYLLFFW